MKKQATIDDRLVVLEEQLAQMRETMQKMLEGISASIDYSETLLGVLAPKPDDTEASKAVRDWLTTIASKPLQAQSDADTSMRARVSRTARLMGFTTADGKGDREAWAAYAKKKGWPYLDHSMPRALDPRGLDRRTTFEKKKAAGA